MGTLREYVPTSPVAATMMAIGLLFSVLKPPRLPGAGLDASWSLGIIEATLRNFQFGRDLTFTYGPLGFLDLFPANSLLLLKTSEVSFALISICVFVAIMVMLRRQYSEVTTGAILLFIVSPGLYVLGGYSERAISLAIVLGVALVISNLTPRQILIVSVALGITSGVAIQAKFSNGILAVLVSFAGLFLAKQLTFRRKAILLFCFTSVVLLTTALSWGVTHQQLENFPTWLLGSIHLTTGYAEAMSSETPDGLFQYLMGFMLIILALFLVLSSDLNLRTKTCLFLFTALVSVLGFKVGFTRHDLGHAGQFFQMTLVLLAGLPSIAKNLWKKIVGMAVASLLLLSAWGASYFDLINPTRILHEAENSMRISVDNTFRSGLIENSKNQIISDSNLPSYQLAQIGNATVHIDPWDISTAWAFGLNWKPVPIFQTYSTYDSYLDELNASYLLSENGPEFVLKRTTRTIDQRNPAWESPLYVEALACGYEQVSKSTEWLLLKKSTNACNYAAATFTDYQPLTKSIPVNVPQATSSKILVSAEIIYATKPLYLEVAELTFKPFTHYKLNVDKTSYRVPAQHLKGPLVVKSSSSSDWGTAFGGGIDYATITSNFDGNIRFKFLEVRPR